jgi:hypothetical protein
VSELFRSLKRIQSLRSLASSGSRKLWRSPSSRWVVAFCLIAPALVVSTAVSASATVASDRRSRQLQRILDRVKERLGLDYPVTLEIVARNRHLISVEPLKDGKRTFLVRIEERMLTLLGSDELEAALAHELGHVWVFTHHPYLQTEQLANDVAMRVVSRDSLARVYDKVWKAGAEKGDLATFLGPAPAVNAGSGAGKQE